MLLFTIPSWHDNCMLPCAGSIANASASAPCPLQIAEGGYVKQHPSVEAAFQHYRVVARHLVVAGLAAHAAKWTAHPFLQQEVFKTEEFQRLKERFLQELPVSKSCQLVLDICLHEQTRQHSPVMLIMHWRCTYP